jgi:hypothetical protein
LARTPVQTELIEATAWDRGSQTETGATWQRDAHGRSSADGAFGPDLSVVLLHNPATAQPMRRRAPPLRLNRDRARRVPASATRHMATHSDSTSSHASPIDARDARQIAAAFGLSEQNVILDAQQVAAWQDPADDLLVSLARRHAFQLRGAVAYLLSLRMAMRPQPSSD